MRLIADCGNTTVKFALVHEGGIWLQERLAVDRAAWDDFLDSHRSTVSELVIVPTGRSAAAVEAWWTASGVALRVLGRSIHAPDVGQYAGFGMDRLCAGLAAVAQERCDVIVVDCGTATTFTAWSATPIQVRGGMILPGAQAWVDGLVSAAPALPAVPPEWNPATTLARSPSAAIATAVGIGYLAAVAACLAALRAETGISAVVATGGALAPLLGGVIPHRAGRPSLVCEGAVILAS